MQKLVLNSLAGKKIHDYALNSMLGMDYKKSISHTTNLPNNKEKIK